MSGDNARGPLLAIGGCGSGKTYALRALADRARAAGWGVVVLDPNDEWSPAADWAAASTVEHVKRAMGDGHRFIIVRPALDLTAGARPYVELANGLAAVVCRAAGWVLVIPECHMALREGFPCPPALSALLHRWRHVGSTIWLDTQHLRDVSKEAVNACTRVLCFATGSPRDLAALRNIGGPGLELAVRECGKRAAAGVPGFHAVVEPLVAHTTYPLHRL